MTILSLGGIRDTVNVKSKTHPALSAQKLAGNQSNSLPDTSQDDRKRNETLHAASPAKAHKCGSRELSSPSDPGSRRCGGSSTNFA